MQLSDPVLPANHNLASAELACSHSGSSAMLLKLQDSFKHGVPGSLRECALNATPLDLGCPSCLDIEQSLHSPSKGFVVEG